MALFTSTRERRLWLWALVVVVAIYATLGPAVALAQALRERNLLWITVVLVLLLAVGIVAAQWRRRRPGPREIGVALGIVAIYLMVMLRVQIPEERTHLFEYGLLAVLIHQALLERFRTRRPLLIAAVLAVAITALLGWLDEGIQVLLPNRVYDLRDVAFNALAGLMAVVASVAVMGARRWGRRARAGRQTARGNECRRPDR